MGNPLGGRGQDKLMAMCLFPSINYTPIKYVMPLPYPVWRMLGNSEDTIVTVKFNDSEVYGLKNTYQPDCVGDFPGQGGGVKSKTVSDEVRPTDGSATVVVNGQKLVRKGDPCTLNKANTFGKYMTLGEALSGIAHLVLGALSFLPPPVGTIASLADAAIYALEGDLVGAGMAAAGAVPGCKWAMALRKLTKGIKLANMGKVGNMFTKAGTWIKGVTGKVKPCVLGGLGNVALNIAPMFFGAPVHAYRGAKVLMGEDDLDYQGNGYLPFYLQRLYNSQNPDFGWFG
ncbi:PAAR-like domain-containing protein [Faucicola atlantae]|uniref:PAAR-like domain-containing protein n=1 Tax=Faucicola atlantae TaxID=34059 RepID=UPI0025B25915|nr:PAAR-like domain-containing protein [Moraxella atlantae]